MTYAPADCLRNTLQKVEVTSNILLNWFSNTYMVVNADRSHLLTSTSRKVSAKIENKIVKNSSYKKNV